MRERQINRRTLQCTTIILTNGARQFAKHYSVHISIPIYITIDHRLTLGPLYQGGNGWCSPKPRAVVQSRQYTYKSQCINIYILMIFSETIIYFLKNKQNYVYILLVIAYLTAHIVFVYMLIRRPIRVKMKIHQPRDFDLKRFFHYTKCIVTE